MSPLNEGARSREEGLPNNHDEELKQEKYRQKKEMSKFYSNQRV